MYTHTSRQANNQPLCHFIDISCSLLFPLCIACLCSDGMSQCFPPNKPKNTKTGVTIHYLIHKAVTLL